MLFFFSISSVTTTTTATKTYGKDILQEISNEKSSKTKQQRFVNVLGYAWLCVIYFLFFFSFLFFLHHHQNNILGAQNTFSCDEEKSQAVNKEEDTHKLQENCIICKKRSKSVSYFSK